jgi:hypothetical protein
MIAVRQMDFIGNVVRAPHNRPAQHMLSACCDNTRLVDCPFLHNKDHIVRISYYSLLMCPKLQLMI